MEAATGEEAIALIDGPNQCLDVLFTDIRLGGALTGWDVAEIFLYASGNSIAPRRDVSGSEFFNKPYRIDDILEACRRLPYH